MLRSPSARSLRQPFLVAASLLVASLAPRVASAAESKTITGTATLGGDELFDVFTVAAGATLKVLQAGSGSGDGRLKNPGLFDHHPEGRGHRRHRDRLPGRRRE